MNYLENDLETIWSECFKLCVDGINNGSFGIACIITNNNGKIISKGRNQLFDNKRSCNKIKNTVVSHAEINALAGLPNNEKNNRKLTLYSTVEPCPMCIGAIVMSKVKNIVIAMKDNWAGGIGLLKKDK